MDSIIHQNARSILGPSDATRHPPEVLAVAIRARVDVIAAEEHVVSVVTIAPRSGPIEPVEITAADRRTIHVPGIDEVIRIGS